MRRWKGPSAELCDDSRPGTPPARWSVAGALLKRSAVPLFTRTATSLFTAPYRTRMGAPPSGAAAGP